MALELTYWGALTVCSAEQHYLTEFKPESRTQKYFKCQTPPK